MNDIDDTTKSILLKINMGNFFQGDYETFCNSLKKVLQKIPQKEKIIINNNLERIGGTRESEVLTNNRVGACTCENEKCKILIDLNQASEYIELTIAEELAHSYFKHKPGLITESDAEEQVKNKTKEWGFDITINKAN